MQNIINRFILTVILLSGIYSCNQSSVIKEPKYMKHQTYDDFLTFLKVKIDTINDEFHKISFIRRKVSEIIDGGLGIKDVSVLDEEWFNWKGEQYYNVFYNNLGTVKCGGSAHFLKNVYLDLGYKSETYDMGCPDVFTHQTTLVKNPIDKNYYIQDAFFNSIFKDDKGNALSFDELIKLLVENKIEKVKFTQKEYDFYPDFDTTGLDAVIKSSNFVREILDSVNYKKNLGEKLTRFDVANISFKVRCVKSQCFKESKLPDNLIYMYLLPLKHNSSKVLELFQNANNGE